MGSGLDIDLSKLGLRDVFSDKNMRNVNALLPENVMQTTEPYVPMEYGDLRGHVELRDDEFTYTEEYANSVYNMDGNIQWTTDGTSGNWLEPSKRDNMKNWEELVASLVEGL